MRFSLRGLLLILTAGAASVGWSISVTITGLDQEGGNYTDGILNVYIADDPDLPSPRHTKD